MSETNYPHLRIQREKHVTPKRSGRPPRFSCSDPVTHAGNLQTQLAHAIEQIDQNIGGFDERRLFRFKVTKGFNPDDLVNISKEIEFVSQEEDEIVVAFVSQSALRAFEARLASMNRGEDVTYREIIYAMQGFDAWTAEDRTGWALGQEGFPASEPFMLDVELWPLEFPQERKKLWNAFEVWLGEQKIQSLDSVKQPGIALYRIRCTCLQAELLLQHRDIRTVDLPPRYGLALHLLTTDIQQFPLISPPLDDAPAVTVLDSGIAGGHPLLAPAVGDAQSFITGLDEIDGSGHGTLVAGVALYGNTAKCIKEQNFMPKLRLFSGRILDEHNEANVTFIENQVIEAVRYFHREYRCKIFNLSFGDQNKPYFGKHVRGLACILDELARELKVLFVVAAGNVPASQLNGLTWKDNYPAYLSDESWSIIDPATALNVLTVGSLARYDKTFSSQRYSSDPAEIPLARHDQPSPFTRCGPSVGGALKPELVMYGGNWALNTRAGSNHLVTRGLGEVSTFWKFAEGHLFAEDSGTSFAAPHVTHLAGRILTQYPDVGVNLLRALLVAHAAIPNACVELLKDKKVVNNVCGYGQVNTSALIRSLQNQVTLMAEAHIENKRHHFYEIPIPDGFVSSGSRTRELTVALSYIPAVRSTRIKYKASRIDFKLVTAPDLNHVVTMFNKATEKDDYENIPELNNPSVNSQRRGKGTVQAATWQFKQFRKDSKLRTKRLFVVITRNDFPWGEVLSDTEEAYGLVVCLKDRKHTTTARLYTQLRDRLQERERARAKVI